MAIDAKQLGNQPAAPFSAYEEEVKIRPTQHAGLTKREHFAGLAMQGILAGLPVSADYSVNVTARQAVVHADALLAELAKDGA